jgi:hypothetical protein
LNPSKACKNIPVTAKHSNAYTSTVAFIINTHSYINHLLQKGCSRLCVRNVPVPFWARTVWVWPLVLSATPSVRPPCPSLSHWPAGCPATPDTQQPNKQLLLETIHNEARAIRKPLGQAKSVPNSEVSSS